MTCFLKTLSPELLICIAELLTRQDDRLNFARCSRWLYDCIYHVSLQNLEFLCDRACSPAPKLHALLELILAQPAIASNVHSLSLFQAPTETTAQEDQEDAESGMGLFSEPPFVFEEEFVLSTELLELVKLVAPHTREIADERSWLIDLDKGQIGPFVALLVISLPNLQSLDFHILNESGYFMAVVGLACLRKAPFDSQSSISPFRRLRRVSNYGGGDSQRDGRYLLPFLQLPSIQRVVLEQVGADRRFKHEPSLDNPSTVTDLEILRCVKRSAIRSFIGACKRLKSFKYTCLPGSSRTLGTAGDMQIFDELLDNVDTTLESLYLDIPPLTLHHSGARTYTRSYKGLKQLRRLAIRAPDLLGINNLLSPSNIEISLPSSLPDSLESLHILGLSKEVIDTVIDQIELLLRSRDGGRRFPHLSEILLEEFTYDFDYRPGFNPVSSLLQEISPTYRSIMKMSKETGVDFRHARTVYDFDMYGIQRVDDW